MSDSSTENNTLRNPITGAFSCLGLAACAAGGATYRENNVHDEAITMLLGGVMTGAMAGALGMCIIPKVNKESSASTRFASWLITLGLEVAVVLTAPEMAEVVGYDTANKEDTIVDTFIGMGFATAVIVALGCLALCTCGIAYCRSTTFAQTQENPLRSDLVDVDDVKPDLESGGDSSALTFVKS